MAEVHLSLFARTGLKSDCNVRRLAPGPEGFYKVLENRITTGVTLLPELPAQHHAVENSVVDALFEVSLVGVQLVTLWGSGLLLRNLLSFQVEIILGPAVTPYAANPPVSVPTDVLPPYPALGFR